MSIVVLPVLFEGDVKAAIELASFAQFNEVHLAFLDQLTAIEVGIVLNTIAATIRTEQLLKQSQARWQKSFRANSSSCRQQTRSCKKKRSFWRNRKPKLRSKIRKSKPGQRRLWKRRRSNWRSRPSTRVNFLANTEP